jgi:hypothetical protein
MWNNQQNPPAANFAMSAKVNKLPEPVVSNYLRQ